MGNRSLFEINHDFAGRVHDRPAEFGAAMLNYLASASERNADALEPFGVRVFGMRHHSDGFDIKWGAVKASQSSTP